MHQNIRRKFLRYVNEVLFEMFKKNETYLGGTTPTELQNDVSTWRKMYYNKENWVMFNQWVNSFYTRFLFKIDALPQDVVLPLYTNATLFNNLSPEVR